MFQNLKEGGLAASLPKFNFDLPAPRRKKRGLFGRVADGLADGSLTAALAQAQAFASGDTMRGTELAIENAARRRHAYAQKQMLEEAGKGLPASEPTAVADFPRREHQTSQMFHGQQFLGRDRPGNTLAHYRIPDARGDLQNGYGLPNGGNGIGGVGPLFPGAGGASWGGEADWEYGFQPARGGGVSRGSSSPGLWGRRRSGFPVP